MLSCVEDGKKYTFIPKSNWVKNIEILNDKIILSNDVFTKQNVEIKNVPGELIICSDLTKLSKFCKKITYETYDEYLEIIEKRDWTKENWVYNILDGISEQNKILYRDDDYILIPNYTWSVNLESIDTQDVLQMYLLAFPISKTLHSLRDLNNTHIDLLKKMKTTTLGIIKSMFGFDHDAIKMYIHYMPSTYHLHIHFVPISNTDVNSSVEYSHDLDNIINILQSIPNYYQTNTIKKRI